ncbi:MAG TPA: ABC transporter substrate-binding protein [Polyangiaceae bacterium]
MPRWLHQISLASTRLLFFTLGLLCLACSKQSPTIPAGQDGGSTLVLNGLSLRVADQSGLSRASLQLAQVEGTPYRIEWSTFVAGPPLLEALGADALDIGGVGDTPPIFAQAAGAPIRIVAVTENSPQYEVILVPEKSPLRSVKDLRGKKVAFAKGSGAHHLLMAALHKEGLAMNEITAAYLTPNDAQPAFTNGDVDAWAIWDPYAANNLRHGARKLVDGEGYIHGYGFQVSSEKSLKDPAKVAMLAEYLGRAKQAQAWGNAHRDAWSKKYAELTKLAPEVAHDMFQHYAPVYVPIDQQVQKVQQELADSFYEAGVIGKRIDVREIFDERFNTLFQD